MRFNWIAVALFSAVIGIKHELHRIRKRLNETLGRAHQELDDSSLDSHE